MLFRSHLCPFRPSQVQGVHLGGRNEQIWGTSERLQLRVEGNLLPLVNGYGLDMLSYSRVMPRDQVRLRNGDRARVSEGEYFFAFLDHLEKIIHKAHGACG